MIIGSWANPGWVRRRRPTSDTKPRQKEFVRVASQVCCRWREIARWQGHAHRWRMRLSLTFIFTGFNEDAHHISRKLSRFRQGLQASDGCDLLVTLDSRSRTNLDSDFEFDDAAGIKMQLFMHGIKMLRPYLPQILALDVQASQSDPLHLLFGILQQWSTRSRLTSLGLSYSRHFDACMRELPSSLSDYQSLGLPRSKNEHEISSHSLPPTLAYVHLESVFLPKTFALPYGLKHLAITHSHSGTDVHSLIPHPSQLTYLDLDMRNTDAPSTEFHLDGVLTFRLQIDLMSLLTWSRVLYAKSLQDLNLAVFPTESDESLSMFGLSLPSYDDEWLPLLAPVHLELKCSANALRGILSLSLLKINGLADMNIEFDYRGHVSWKMNEYLESLFQICSTESEELIFPLLQTMSIATGGEKWCQTLEYTSFPKLETLSYTRHNPPLTINPDEALDFTEWLSFCSTHESNSFNNLATLIMWLPDFKAGQIHPLEYAPKVVELQVDLQPMVHWSKDSDMWMMYPGTCLSPHSPPLTRLQIFAVHVGVNHNISLEDNLETKIHGIQASRVQHGVGLERACIQWHNKTTEFRQNITTGFLERVP